MGVPTEPNPTKASATQWNYVEIQVIDGQRVLRPTHIAFDRLIFAEPPNLISQQVEIIITNNGQSHSSQALILPHELSATYIPIELINTEQKAPAKLTA
jgi:hypothetical protein